MVSKIEAPVLLADTYSGLGNSFSVRLSATIISVMKNAIDSMQSQ